MSTVEGSGNIINDGLVLYLDAANTKSFVSGNTIWNDLSRGGNNGTLTNGPTFNSGNGGSIVFDGSDDYVDLGSTINNFFRINLPFTIDIVVYINTSISEESFIGNAWDDPGVLIRKTSTNFIRFIFIQSGSVFKGKDSSILSSGWYHVVVTYNGNGVNTLSNYSLYINSSTTGVTNLSSGTITSIVPLNNLNLGRSGDSTNFAYFNGKIFNCKIYNRSLSDTEVLQNFNSTRSRFGV